MSAQAGTGPVLSLAGLNKSYGALQATRDVALEVGAGEIHALIGPNGAGKTTLVRQIYGSEAPDSGSIRLRGEEISHLSVPQRVRQGIGRSFQIWLPSRYRARETDARSRAKTDGLPSLRLGARPPDDTGGRR